MNFIFVKPNRQLGQVIAEAKVNNVPRDVITRNIEKGNAAATGAYGLNT
jgi:transcriptional/translational regulatory protein YebC/TACO1